jgi:hypothetical protein
MLNKLYAFHVSTEPYRFPPIVLLMLHLAMAGHLADNPISVKLTSQLRFALSCSLLSLRASADFGYQCLPPNSMSFPNLW